MATQPPAGRLCKGKDRVLMGEGSVPVASCQDGFQLMGSALVLLGGYNYCERNVRL